MTQNTAGLSIRYKIIVLLTALPIAMLATYLLIAIGVFKDDKKAYVYEASSTLAKAVAAQTKAQFSSLLAVTRPVVKDFLKQGGFTEEISDAMKLEPLFVAARVYSGESADSSKDLAERAKSNDFFDSEKIAFEKQLLSLVYANGKVSRMTKNGLLLIGEKVVSKVTLQTYIFIFYFMAPELKSLFETPGATELFLVTKDEIIFGPEGIGTNRLPGDWGPEVSQILSNSKNNEGVQSIENRQMSKIVSFARTGFSDLVVIGLVDKEHAFGAVNILIQKSLLFFGLLISVTIIISFLATTQLTNTLTELFLATKRLAQGDFKLNIQVKSKDEVGSLAEGFNIMTTEIERLIKETEVKARMESELKTAKIVQNTLFPELVADLEGMSIAGCYEPASECGGDWWHYCKIGDKYFLWIGDATGHGAPAALLTSAARSASSILERLNVDPAVAMGYLNQAVFDVAKGNLMMTFFIGSYDPKTKVLTYCNASHEPPLLFKKSDVDRKRNDIIPLMESHNARIGQSRETKYSQVEIVLEDGDQIVFYTDGVIDLRNEEDKILGERLFYNVLLKSVDHQHPSEVVKNLMTAFNSFRGQGQLVDDLTFFVVQTGGVGENHREKA